MSAFDILTYSRRRYLGSRNLLSESARRQERYIALPKNVHAVFHVIFTTQAMIEPRAQAYKLSTVKTVERLLTRPGKRFQSEN